MEDLTFLRQLDGDYGANNATIKVVDPDGFVSHISDCVCPYRLLDNCPLLYHAFEHGSRGRLQASIEAPSRAAVISLLRHCYTYNYLPVYMEDAPPLLLLHAHVYKIAEDFDVPELQLSAHGNFSVQIESACSLPAPPQDFLETIRYVYANFASPQARQQQGLVHTLLNYCISVFLNQRLGESADFLAVVRQLPEFRQDLCRTNMERNFQDDCAFDIINLALDTLQPQHSFLPRPTLLASRDLPEPMLFDRPATPPRPIRVMSLRQRRGITESLSRQINLDQVNEALEPWSPLSDFTTLVHRPKQPVMDVGFVTDTSSEDEGFSIVRRPSKPSVRFSIDDPMSSPEIIPLKSMDVLAATGSNYPTDDEWTML